MKEWADKYKGSTAETTDVASTIGHRFTCTIAKVTLEVRAVFSLQRQLPPFMLRHQFKPRDSEFLADMTRQKGSDIHTDQLEPGDFEGVIDFAGTTDTQIFRGRFSRVVCNHGSVPGGMAAFTFPVTPESAIFCGEKVAAGTLCVIAPGDYYSYLAAADHPFFGGCIVAERLDRALRLLHHTTLAKVLPRTATVRIPPVVMAQVHAATNAAFVLPPNCAMVLDLEALDGDVEEALIAALCAALTADSAPQPTRRASRNHWRCIRTVREYVEAHLGEDLRVERLCQIAGVSERTLETAFREVTQCGPRQFVRMRRLNAARHALAHARFEDVSVKAVALECGFRHMGRFAHDYRAHFGESPSASVART